MNTEFTRPDGNGDSPVQRLKSMMEAGETQRFHAGGSYVPPQSVGQHVYGVMVIATFVREDISPELLVRCLTHDAEERFTGDVPFTAKRAFKSFAGHLKDLEEHVRNAHLWPVELWMDFHLAEDTGDSEVLKLADMLEGLRYASIYGYNQEVAHRWFSALNDCFTSPTYLSKLLHVELQRAYSLMMEFAPSGIPGKFHRLHTFDDYIKQPTFTTNYQPR